MDCLLRAQKGPEESHIVSQYWKQEKTWWVFPFTITFLWDKLSHGDELAKHKHCFSRRCVALTPNDWCRVMLCGDVASFSCVRGRTWKG